jgi:hypothetical protein
MFPHHEPEVTFANGRAYASRCNNFAREPYENVFVALELAEHAHHAHGLPYKPGPSNIREYPPGRFTWFCDETGDAKNSVKIRDDKTRRVVTDSHWRR